MIETILCIIFLILGVAIGYKLSGPTKSVPASDLEKKVDKLEKELIVYKNLKESLLNDVAYWRSRVEK